MEICIIARIRFGLDYRTTEGLCNQLFTSFGLRAPDYSTMCKRFSQLEVEIKQFIDVEETEVAGDGTGRSQNRRGYYREENYEIAARKYVRVTATVKIRSKEVAVSIVTESEESEIPALKKAVEQTAHQTQITKLFADRLHDSKTFRGELIKNLIEPVIPTRRTTTNEGAKKNLERIAEELQKVEKGSDGYYEMLGEQLRFSTLIQMEENYEAWRDSTGYGNRATIENVFSRDTLIFGDCVLSRKLLKAEKEMMIRFTMLNLFTVLARAKTRLELCSTASQLKTDLRNRGGLALKAEGCS